MNVQFGGYDYWGFTIHNVSNEDFSRMIILYGVNRIETGQISRPSDRSFTFPGDVPRAADFQLTSADGAKTTSVHVQIPRPPPLDRNSPFYTGIPRVYFIIHNDQNVEVSFKNPHFSAGG